MGRHRRIAAKPLKEMSAEEFRDYNREKVRRFRSGEVQTEDCLNCPTCGKSVTNRQRRYCSDQCRPSVHPGLAKQLGISCGKVGAIAELVVCADLIRRGFEVFRSVSQDCSCDLIVLKDGQAQRVEVKTAVQREEELFIQ